MPVVLAEVTRGGIVESVHYGVVAVADVEGTLVAAAGNPGQVAYFRSSAKPFQAIPVVESGAADAYGFTPAELALCCASHAAEARHQAAVATMLAKLGLGPEALQCGAPLPMDEREAARVITGAAPKSALQCDCSGKHTGMLAACLQLGYPIETYLEPAHPLQRTIRSIMAKVLRLDEPELQLATDGCSLPTFGAPLQAFAVAYATLARPEGAPAARGGKHAAAQNRLRAAMLNHPENVAGEHALVTDLMRLANGAIVAKSGAEGLLCLGIAIRIADGSFRAHAVVATAVLEQLDLVSTDTVALLLDHHNPVLRNHNGREVGEIRSAVQLETETVTAGSPRPAPARIADREDDPPL